MSNDAGEDSNDDLDESHTEDNSRVTDLDLETPSYSEDTFSKEENVFFNTSNAALSTAPVIPTSSQYGLAIVPSSVVEGVVGGASNCSVINDSNGVVGALDGLASVVTDGRQQECAEVLREVHSHGRNNERFKVVKIESTEPFKRGRWTCMDYLDHNTASVNQPTAIGAPKVSDPNEVCISYGVTDSGMIVVPEATAGSKQQQASVVTNDEAKGTIGIDVANGPVSSDNPQVVQVHSSSTAANYAISNSIPSNVQHNSTQTKQQQQPPSSSVQQIPQQYFQSQTQQQQQQQSQQSQQNSQGSTLPSSLQPATHPNNLGQQQQQPQSMPQGSIPIITQASNSTAAVTSQQQPTSVPPHSKEESYVPVQSVCQPTTVQQTTSVPTSQAPNIHVTQQSAVTEAATAASCQQQSPPSISEPLTAIQGIQGMPPSIHKVPQATGAGPQPQTQQQQTSSTIHPATGAGPVQSPQVIAPASTQQQQTQPTQTSNGNTAQPAAVQIAQAVTANCPNVVGGTLQQGNTIVFHQSDTEQEQSISGIVPNSTAVSSADVTLLESLAEVTQGSDEHRALEDNESMSGTSAVAIDNKIEQAMDLVKSHLMFAVREEVEVLKEKIAELMDRINQLEAENSILKAHATPETLAQLSQSTAKLTQNNSGSGQ